MLDQTQQTLQKGLTELNLNLSEAQQNKIMDYISLLIKWNKVYNLTSVKDPQQIVIRHILDSLSIIKYIDCYIKNNINPKEFFNVIDVGSGGGLPGIIIAIYFLGADNNKIRVTLIDSNNKKTAFLKQVAIELNLDNVVVVNNRVENISGLYDIIISRAFASLLDFVKLTNHLLDRVNNNKAVFLAMKAKLPLDEIKEFNKVYDSQLVINEDNIYKLSVPFMAEPRHLIKIEKI